ncbi:hypothetical protein KUTeg_012109 [Tegillarca granosa]|uniref:Uncharacterized protein n=1 Tax=Tegillarca granosa TaxID=220873 RepID=A0ABQ9EYT7_TEGGR|nr:hypothetical protein KUTeg_012109 [Tegillarca granosa]
MSSCIKIFCKVFSTITEDSSKNFYRDVNIYENVVKIIKSNFSTSVEHMSFVMFIGNYLVSAGRIRKNKLREITC